LIKEKCLLCKFDIPKIYRNDVQHNYIFIRSTSHLPLVRAISVTSRKHVIATCTFAFISEGSDTRRGTKLIATTIRQVGGSHVARLLSRDSHARLTRQ